MATRRTPPLIAEGPLLALPSLVRALGTVPAIVLSQVHYRASAEGGWVERPVAIAATSRYQHRAWSHELPWSVDVIRKALRELERRELIESEQVRGGNRTKRYRVNYDVVDALGIGPVNRPGQEADRPPRSGQIAAIHSVRGEGTAEGTTESESARTRSVDRSLEDGKDGADLQREALERLGQGRA